MTSVWTQLRLLLWKNFMIRRRQKKWLTVELLTPVVLFLFLALIRTRDFSDPNPTCHYDAKAMPGTGLLPFLQSLLCGLANTCQSKPTTGDDQGIVGRNMPNDSLLVTTLRDVSKFLSSTGADSEPLQMLARDLVKIVQTLAHLPVSDPAYADPNVPIASFFNKGTNISSVLNDELKNYTAAEMLSTASLTPYFFVTALRELLPSLNNLTAGSGMQLAMQLLPVADEIIKEAFCDADSRRKSVVLVNGGDPPEQLCNFSIFNLAIGIYFGGENPFNASGAIVAVAHALPALTGRNITAATALDLLAISTSLQNELGASNLQALIKDVFDFFASAGNGTSGVLDTLTCGQLNSLRSQVNTGSTTLGGGSNALQEFIEKVMNSSAPSPGPGNGTLGECGSIVIQKDPPGCDRVMFLPQLHSVLLGYILVTPPAPAVKKLVAKLESLLRDINAVRNSLFRFNSDGAAYQDALANSDLSKAMAVVRDMIDHLNKTMGGLPLPPAWQSAITTVEHLFGPANDSRSLFPLIKNPVDMLANFTKCIATNRFVFADNERQLEEMGICLGGQNLYFTGLVFVNVSDDAAEFPLLTTYKIRPANALSDSTMYSRDSASHIAPRDNPIRDLKYLTFGFSFLQDAVERALIEMRTNESVPIGTYAQQTPHPCYNRDRFAELIPGFVPLFIVLSWIIPAALVVKNIVHEKELRLKEVMRVMGLGDAVHWVAWGLQAFVTQFISVILIVGLLKVGSIPRSDASVLFVLLTLFSVSCITQCLLLATFFSRANIATAATTIFYFLARFPYDIGRRRIQGFWPKMISCLMSQSAIGWGFNEVAMWEQRRIGVQWSNIRLSGNEYGGDINLLSILVAFVVEIFIHLLLTWYISAVFPGQYGIAEPWYFFVTRKYWLGPKIARNGPDELERSEKFDSIAQVHPSEDFEAEPVGVRLAVDIRNLKKTYSNGTKAVDGLSVRFYESQITSFLGHNGAGKTTTMSILTGLYPPTSGTAYIYDKDIRTDIQEIRKSLGMCPQHNVLFDTLTVKEQLRFYAGLKGMDASQASTEIDQMIKDIGLSDKGNEFADQLSGGMKRKLSIGIAFIGGSRTVILDEPTAGVDPHARRGIWDLLIKYKQGRTIIMSTHHMDEADVLGDRIAIVAEGRLRAWGSSLFLKTRFGSGYRLTVLKAGGIGASRSNPSLPDLVPPAGSASFLDSSSSKIKHSSGLVDFVTSRVDGSQLVEEFHQEIVFSLPLAFDLDAMQRFFLELDDNLSRFAVASYGISASSLEEIFLTVAPMREDSLKKEHVGCQCLRGLTQHLRLNKGAKNRSDAGELMQDDSESSGDEGPAQETKRLKKFAKHPSVRYIESSSALAMHRIKAMQYKRLHNFRRSPKGAFCELVLPVLLILVATISYSLVGQSMGVKQNQPPLLLNPWLYGDSNYPNVIFYSIENNDTNPSGQKYFDALTDWPGLGVKCVPDDPFSDPNDDMVCNGNNTWVDPPSNETFAYNVSQQCGCGSDSLWQCTYNDYWPKPSARWTNTSDILVDMTARNISQWILMSYQEFLFNRYGGFSLGEIDKKAMDERDVQNATVGVDRLTALIDEIGRNLSIVVHVNASFVNDPFDQNRTVSGVLKKALASMTTAENVQVWFNNKGWASYPAYANTMNNAILRALLPPSLSPDEVGISVFNHPMNYSAEERVLDSGSQNFRSQVYLFQTVLIILAFCIIPASFVLFLIEERVNHSKHQQFVSGVPPWLYWVSSFMWDMANFMMPVVLVMLVFWATGALAYTRTIHEASALFFLLVLYGFAAIPFMYLFSFVFRVAPLAFVVLGGGTFFVGMIATIAVWVLRFIQETGLSTDPDLKTAYDVCKVVFLILPQFNLGSGVMDMTTTYTFYETTVQYLVTLKRQDLINEIPMPSLYSWDHLGKGYVCLLVQGFIFFGLTLLIEYRRTIFKCRCKTNTKAVAKRRASIGGTEDVDVREERQRVEAAADSDDTGLVVRGLTKMYGSKKKLAVDRLTFKVEKGECFGLLGINGAGKTTTFKMLTGKILVDEGDACFHGLSVRRDMHQIYQMVGYCPQFDAQNALLTGREQLAFYARIRGIVEADIEKVVDWAIDNMQLTVYGDETTGSYSGGNKRKLSTALALIGDPAVVLLDEPSAGMDPNARRFMWNLIMDLRRDNHTVVLTSHSMEECETLCTRIGIMVSGRLQCLGSVQHLKHKFGDGYSLTIKLRSADPAVIERACKVIEAELPGARLDDCHCATVRYKLPTRGFRLAAAFKAIQKVRASVDVEDYSLSQTTLDEVFINFAEKQTNADEGGSERLEEEEEAKGEVPFTDHSVSHVAQVVEEPQGEDSVTNEAQASDFVILRPTAKAPKKKRRRSLVPIADGETKKAADTIVMLNHSPSSSSQSEAGASPPNNVQNV